MAWPWPIRRGYGVRLIFLFLLLANLVLLTWEGLGRLLPTAPTADLQKAQREPLPQGVQEIRLLAAREPPGEAPPERGSTPIDSGPALRCHLFGPLSEAALAQSVMATLRAQGWRVRMTGKGQALSEDFWVVLPPRASRQEALMRLREFQQRDIDSFVVTQGEAENAISLGLFTQRSLAEAHGERLRALGYPEIEVRVIPRDGQEVWLQVAEPVDAPGSEVAWSTVRAQAGSAARQPAACDEALSGAVDAVEFAATPENP